MLVEDLQVVGEYDDSRQISNVLCEVSIYRRDVVLRRRVRRKKRNVGSGGEGSKRGKVKEFTDASRKRLAFVAANTDVRFTSLVTLTYPRDFPADGALVKSHFKAFLNRCRRSLPPFEYLWFLEFQERGAPHFHMILDKFVDYKFVARAWSEIIGSDAVARSAGTKAEGLRSHSGAYAVKYAAKMRQKIVPAEYENVGRFWGHSRAVAPKVRRTFHATEMELAEMSGGESSIVRSLAAGYNTLFNRAGELDCDKP